MDDQMIKIDKEVNVGSDYASKLLEYRRRRQILEFNILATNCKVNKNHVLLLSSKNGPQKLELDG
jgi:hypothetical protein